jgi:hypothetical protein
MDDFPVRGPFTPGIPNLTGNTADGVASSWFHPGDAVADGA